MTDRDQLYLAALFHDIGKIISRQHETAKTPTHQEEGNTLVEQWLSNHGCTNTHIPALIQLHHQEDLTEETDEKLMSLATLLQEADRLASGERVEIEESQVQHRLQSIFNNISLPNYTEPNTPHYQPFSSLTPRSFKFPEETDSSQNYQEKWVAFETELMQVSCEAHETLIHLFRKHLWCVPASKRKYEADISLYEHARLTASIATCLYDFHHEQTEVSTPTAPPFLLFCADLTGIQDFIYNIGHRKAVKALKGRSFFLGHLLDTIARHILQVLNLPFSNLIYSSGGKFYVLLPNLSNMKDTLEDIEKNLQKRLLATYDGEIGIIMGWIPLTKKDFLPQNGTDKLTTIADKWEEVGRAVETKKRNRWLQLIGADFFAPYGPSGNVETCFSTSVDLFNKDAQDHIKERLSEKPNEYYDDELEDSFGASRVVSKEQATMFQLGKELRSLKTLYLQAEKGFKVLDFNWEKGGQYYDKDDIEPLDIFRFDSKNLSTVGIKINDDDFLSLPTETKGWKFYGGDWIPTKSNASGNETTRDFDDMQVACMGIKRLGVLRMDVDNLGLIFQKGLGKKATFSRITQLSTMLDFFFSSYLNKLKHCYWHVTKGVIESSASNTTPIKDVLQIVYAGGDDLFIIGIWNILPDVALWIQKEFTRFCGYNKSMTLSGGVALFANKFPAYKAAQQAGNAEHQAKASRFSYGQDQMIETKNSFSFLNVPLEWASFNKVSAITKDLYQWIEEGKSESGKDYKLDRSILSHVARLKDQYEERRAFYVSKLKRHEIADKKVIEKESLHQANYSRFRWRSAYTFKRFTAQNKAFSNEIQDLSNFIAGFNPTLERPSIELLALSTRWAELLTRKEDKL